MLAHAGFFAASTGIFTAAAATDGAAAGQKALPDVRAQQFWL